ncbi:MAG: sugar transferase [Anaerococcus prevotii]|uniref:sugar transferase n=1 Tax=Anaerococcus prevotii TaxID=33034 RepID=UPI0028FEE76A|nr:sugar transferase [Anaerococcus prevotii]MDU2558469.1 sugar transferase [Anaerococcus prevotii]
MIYEKIIKRILDIVLALIALPFVLIICIIFGILIYLEDRGDIFYIAKRRGLNGTVFGMYKLRSMKMNAPDIRNEDNSTYNSSNDPRVTKIGRILRKTSIDELPQVFNILKGDMSWIGPRPNNPSKVYEDMTDGEKKRLSIRPGVTGYSQAYYRNSINQGEKLKKDVFYSENVRFVFDFKIFIQTIKTVLLQKNINTN